MMSGNDADLLGLYAKVFCHELKHALVRAVLLCRLLDRY